MLAAHGVELNGEGASLAALEELAEAKGWHASTERISLVGPSRRCRALLFRPLDFRLRTHGALVSRGTGPTEVVALGRALATALSRDAADDVSATP